MAYNTAHYQIYDLGNPKIGTHVAHPFVKFGDYDTYTLVINPNITSASEVPKRGVRLDDWTVAFVAKHCERKALNTNRTAEFDQNAMVRAMQVPLGHASKAFKRMGETDLNGHVLTQGEEGFYYDWYHGLHLLCGKEGLDAKVFLKRPSFEVPLCSGVGFKVTAKAVVQLPSGHPDDPTFQGMHLPKMAMMGRILADILTPKPSPYQPAEMATTSSAPSKPDAPPKPTAAVKNPAIIKIPTAAKKADAAKEAEVAEMTESTKLITAAMLRGRRGRK